MNWRPKLKYRSFGKTDLKVSEIGFGCAPIGYTAGFEDDKACIDSVRNAIDLGLNFFDTSPVYGKSEINLGEAIGADRDKIILATKVRLPGFEDANDMKNFIVASVERSLARLKTDYIDLLQIHHQIGNERGKYQFRNNPPEFATRLNYSDCMEFYDCTDLLRSSFILINFHRYKFSTICSTKVLTGRRAERLMKMIRAMVAVSPV